jgi:hypothetical protein
MALSVMWVAAGCTTWIHFPVKRELLFWPPCVSYCRRTGDICLLRSVQRGCGAHSARYWMGTLGSFPWVVRPGHEASLSVSFGAEVKMSWTVSAPFHICWAIYFYHVQTDPGTNLAFCAMDTGSIFTGGNVVGAWNRQCFSVAKAKNAWTRTSTHL